MDNISSPIAITISLFIGIVIALLVQLFLVPWQRREITGNAQNGRVKFTINDSNESTPSGSPKRKQQPRPLSLVQTDPKILPAITEQTELASFNNLGGVTPSFLQNDKTVQQNGGVRQHHSIANGNYKIDPKYIEKAEHLLGNNRSLDNTDLTITSLNYIDEHHHHQHQTNGYLRSIIPRESTQNCFDNQLNSHQLTSNAKQRYGKKLYLQ